MTDNQQPGTTGTAPGTPTPQAQPQASEPTFTLTQAQLNALMADNKRNLQTELEQFKEKAAKWQQYEDSQKTEQQKAQEQLKQFETTAIKATSELNQLRLQIAFEREANKLGIVDPEAAFKLADVSKVKVGEDGTVSGVTETLQALIETRPWLKGQPAKPTAPNINAGEGAGTDGTQFSADILEMSKVTGIPADKLMAQMREIEKRKQQR